MLKIKNLHFALFLFILPTIYIYASEVQAQNSTESKAANCKTVQTKVPPFWVVVGDRSMKDKDYENFREDAKSKKTEHVIPKNSLVKKDPNKPIVIVKNRAEYMPVEVVSVAYDPELDEVREVIKAKHKGKVKGIHPVSSSGKKPVKLKQKGYLYMGKKSGKNPPKNASVASPKDHYFILKKDSTLIDIPGVEEHDQNYYLELDEKNGKYKVERCEIPPGSQNFVDQYVFNIKKAGEDDTTISQFFIGPCQSDALSQIVPIAPQDYEVFLNIAQGSESLDDDKEIGIETLQTLSSLGLVQVPQGEMEKIADQCYTSGPYGSYHYISSSYPKCNSGAKREQQIDSFLLEPVACAFSGEGGVLDRVKQRCPECQVEWGDCFFPKKRRGERGGHYTHYKGTCIDFRPMKKNNSLGACDIKGCRDYGRENTQILVEELIKAGANVVMFNDKNIGKNIRKKKLTRSVSYLGGKGHGNHLHVCFPTKSEFKSRKHHSEVVKTCYP